jgi:non-ribosomal peptide synthetase component F
MLGVLKAGGVFVPLDPSHPKSRLQNLVQSIDSTLLLCSRQHVAHLATVAMNVIALDGDMIESIPTVSDEVFDRSVVNSSNAAYLIFTSGSTGRPKVCTILYMDLLIYE